jgi:hypothetical protein
MDPVAIINASAIGINALLSIIANVKAESGLTDDQIAAMFAQHGEATRVAIAGYLAAL